MLNSHTKYVHKIHVFQFWAEVQNELSGWAATENGWTNVYKTKLAIFGGWKFKSASHFFPQGVHPFKYIIQSGIKLVIMKKKHWHFDGLVYFMITFIYINFEKNWTNQKMWPKSDMRYLLSSDYLSNDYIIGGARSDASNKSFRWYLISIDFKSIHLNIYTHLRIFLL